MTTNATPDTVSLVNCDREPIHIPGAIQPHGALLCLDTHARVTYASANLTDMLGVPHALGQVLTPGFLGNLNEVEDFILDVAEQEDSEDATAQSIEAHIHGAAFDVVAHRVGALTLVEFERRSQDADALASFAQKAYRLIDGLKRQRSVEKLLEGAVQAVREITGFDRVMAYRFRHDDSGDVVAEARRADLESYVGQRYPASDIPAQARRLYLLNTLRLIADVGYQPVPILALPSRTEPLDLSHGILRSVSPIHVEYLQNMGVSASMSVSIVVDGKLWGMLACHHMQPLQVPYSIRMAADVLAQVLASRVQTLAAQEREADITKAAWVNGEAASQITKGLDTFDVLAEHAAALKQVLKSDALLVVLDGKQHVHGDVSAPWVKAVVAQLNAQTLPVVHLSEGSRLPCLADASAPTYCGLLGLRFDAPRNGWIIALRLEQIETIRWGGRPEKLVTHGPLGPRLTPRGSFDEWQETVRGTSEPWTATELQIASQLLDAVGRAHADRVLQQDQMRSQLWAVLGHDLRNPLQSLTMASKTLEMGDRQGRAGRIIRNSTTRMKRLLGDILDVSRVQNGLGLDLNREEVDVAQLVRELIEECQSAYPAEIYGEDIPPSLMAEVDPGRFSQVVANLLSNAHHYGNGQTTVALRQDGDRLVLTVANNAEPIADHIAASLFDPFGRRQADASRNRSGMGLGLYIASSVAKGHQGEIAYQAVDGQVVFTVSLPIRPAQGAQP